MKKNLFYYLLYVLLQINFFAQTTDPNQLKNEGNDALNAKNYAVALKNTANI